MKRKPDAQMLADLVLRIVEIANPQRIILFGSAARGKMGPNSDLDVLVVVPDGMHRRKTAQSIYRNMIGFGFAKDIVVATDSDIKEHGSNPHLIFKQALEEGKELYCGINQSK
ncbi:MAG: nucleotidyltransferase domain-containing protein [bacterium]